jgi:acetyl/propionyl-CoA carboxylase alpha subunit
MDSAARDMLTERRRSLACGPNVGEKATPTASVVTHCQKPRWDASHPGIGFLSENAGFANDCAAELTDYHWSQQQHGYYINNQRDSYRDNNVPVVPGSHGILICRGNRKGC